MLSIRDATAADVPLLLRLIRALAEYERLADAVVATEPALARALFGGHPRAHALIAECDGGAAGFALYFFNFSTFLARAGLHLEDLFVLPERRGQGIGRALLIELARRARDPLLSRPRRGTSGRLAHFPYDGAYNRRARPAF